MEKTTTIRITLKTKEDLTKLGEYGDSMNSIIQRLIAYYTKTRGKVK